MATPVQARRFRSFGERSLSTPGTTPNTASYPSFLKKVILHDWWLTRADSDSHGKRLGIGGFTFKEGTMVQRTFSSASIVERQDAVTLKTDDGVTILVLGFLNKSRTLENGFSHEVCDHFLIGFPYYWEEFADLSVSQERAECSDAVLNEESNAKEGSSLPQSTGPLKDEKTKADKKRKNRSDVEHVTHSGPLTRSKARPLTRSRTRLLTKSRARLLNK